MLSYRTDASYLFTPSHWESTQATGICVENNGRYVIHVSEPPAIKEIFLDHEKGLKHPVFLPMSADINSCGIEHYCLCDFSIFGLKSTRRQSSC